MTGYSWYKGYKAHVCSTPEDVVLLLDRYGQNMLFSVADNAYDSQYIYKIATTYNSFPVNPINSRNGKQIKSSHSHVFITFCKLKDKGLDKIVIYCMFSWVFWYITMHIYYIFATPSNISEINSYNNFFKLVFLI